MYYPVRIRNIEADFVEILPKNRIMLDLFGVTFVNNY